MVLSWLTTTVTGILLERKISKGIDSILEKKEYKKIIGSISTFQSQFVDSEIDRKSFQDFLMKNNTRCEIYQYVYERYSEEVISDKEAFISNLVTRAMSHMNEQNSKYSRSIFTNEDILFRYFNDLLDSLYKQMFSNMSLDSKAQLSTISSLLDKKFSLDYYEKEIHLTTDFLTHSLNRSINNLGGRYTSDFNIETQNKWSLECLGKSDEFLIEINRLRMQVSTGYSTLYCRLSNNEKYTSISELNNIISLEFLDLIKTEITFSTNFFDLKKKLELMALPDVYWIDELSNEEKSILRHYIEPLSRNLTGLIEFLATSNVELIGQPYLLVTGKAGIGKSHLLADYAKKFTGRGHSTFLFLGSYFYKNADPVSQIMESLRIPNSSFKSVLEELERKSVETGNQSIIFIDALNEGAGLTLWKERLIGFIKEIQEYPNIGIVLSIRTEYEMTILPEDFNKLNFSKLKHTGLEGTVNDSIKAFCQYYKLAYPTVPSFNEEYNNPLFLKMVCQLLIDSNIKQFTSNFSIETIMKHYLNKLELNLSAKDRMNFDPKRGILNELILSISELKIESKWSMLEYNTVYDKLITVGHKLAIDSPGILLKELINEGLLQVIEAGEEKIFLDFQFEKFSDFFIADYIYQKYIRTKKIEDLESVPELASYFKDDLALRNNYGVLIMLSTLIANHEKKEIFSYFPKLGMSYLMFEIIFDSFPYRNSSAISFELVKFIETDVSMINELMMYFVTSQFQLSINHNSPINSRWLHNFLLKKNQQEIDLVWTMNISKYYRTFVGQFTKWYREFYEYTNKKDAELILLQLGWILSSTNRYYRDQATLAIVKILNFDSELIKFFISSFVNVKDRYVVERAMAAIYGATINLNDPKKIEEVSKQVYDSFFDVEDLIPNVLARDYGRQIINYAIHHNALNEKVDLSKVFPKYEGIWEYEEVTDEHILELKKIYEKHSGFSSITRSMMTNFGRANGMYGDFGRYTFQSALSPWEEQFDIQDLSNIVVKLCLDLGYSPELFSEFDTLDGRYFDRFSNKEERIGKKYQWIAFYEILANISDNFIPYNLKVTFDDEYNQYIKHKDELWISAITNKDFSGLYEYEEELDENDHIINIERDYQKKWTVSDSYIRNIDVSVTDETPPLSKKRIFDFSLPDYLTDIWMKENIDVKMLRYYISTEFESEEYYALSFYNDDRRQKDGSQGFTQDKTENLTIMGRAVFVKKSELKKLHQEAMNDIGNVSSPTTYNIFLREYYWHEAYINWEKERSEYDKKVYIHSSHCYGWEKADQYTSLDEDKTNESLSLLMPSKILVDFGQLKMDSDYKWKNDKNECVCFDGRFIGGERVLLVKKDFIDEFCLKNEYTIVWFCYYDKIGLNQYHDSHYYFVKEGNQYIYFEQDNKHGYYDR